jgi:hypothetical protein
MKAAIAQAEVDRPNDRRVLAEIARFSLNEGGAFPSYKTLAERLSLGVSTVRQAVYRLLNRGYLAIKHRFRKDGSQTSNKYSLRLPKVPLGSTPLNTRDPSASRDTPLSGGRARRARQSIKNMTVIGALDDDAPVPETRRRYTVKSGNEEVSRSVDEAAAVSKPSRKQIDKARAGVKSGALREQKPLAEWNALDLAQDWRQRLWETGKNDFGTNFKALIKHFRNMLDEGFSAEELRQLSEDYFFDPRNWQDVKGPLIWRKFIASRASRIQKRDARWQQNPHYSPTGTKLADGTSVFAGMGVSFPGGRDAPH